MRSAVTALVASVGVATLLGFFDRFAPYLELASILRPQYVLLLGASAVAAALLRRFPVALAALLLAVVNLLALGLGSSASKSPSASSDRMRLLVLNVQQGNDEYDSVARLIDESDADLVGLLELTPAWATGLQPALEPFPYRRSELRGGAYAIGLYSRLPFDAASIQRYPEDGPPTVVASVPIGSEHVDLVLTHIHTPFAGAIHRRQLDALSEIRDQFGDRLVVCGDFNTAPWSDSLQHFASTSGLRSTHDNLGFSGTWPAGIPILRVPIDNCLISEGLTLHDRRVGPNVGSDHLPLLIDLGLALG